MAGKKHLEWLAKVRRLPARQRARIVVHRWLEREPGASNHYLRLRCKCIAGYVPSDGDLEEWRPV